MAAMLENASVGLPKGDVQACQAAIDRLCHGESAQRALIVIFGYGSFGDALQITPLLAALRQRFFEAQIVLVHPNGLVSALLSASSDVDEVVKSSPNVYSWLRSELLVRSCADLLVWCRYVIEYEIPAASRLGPSERDFVEQARRLQADWLGFVRDFPFDNDALWNEAASRGLNLYKLMALTAGFPERDFEDFRLELRPEDVNARKMLPGRYAVVCNSAEALAITRSHWTKTIAPDQIAAVVAGVQKLGLPCVQLGAADERPINGIDFDWRGKSSLREAAAILRDAKVYIGPEGGLTNLARAVGAQAVVFFGSTPPEFFAFRANANIRPKICGGCWWTTPSYLYHCPRLLGDPECTRSISPEDIVAAACGVFHD